MKFCCDEWQKLISDMSTVLELKNVDEVGRGQKENLKKWHECSLSGLPFSIGRVR